MENMSLKGLEKSLNFLSKNGYEPCLWYRGNVKKNNRTRFFYVLYSDKTWIFDQSDCVQGPIYIIKRFRLVLLVNVLTGL